MEARLEQLEENWKSASTRFARLENKLGMLECDMDEMRKLVARRMMNAGKEKDVQESNPDTQLRIGYASDSGQLPDMNAAVKRIDELSKQMEQLRNYLSTMGPLWTMQVPNMVQQPTLLLQAAPSYPLNIGTWRGLSNPPQYTLVPSPSIQALPPLNIIAPPQASKSVSVTQPSSSKKRMKRPLEPVPSIPHCEYHSGAIGHTTEECPELKERVQKLINEGQLAGGPVVVSPSIPKNKKKK